MTGRRALVTGGAGFLGSHLCERLLAEGVEVVCMDNLITGDLANIAPLQDRDDFRFERHDVTEYIDVPGELDYVLHIASPASPIDYLNLPIQTLKVGSLGTHKALGLARAKGARFLLASTSEVYGDPLTHPQTEDYWGNVNPVGPRGVYDEAKRFAEAITMAYHRAHGVETRIVRIFNTYGPRMRLEDGRVLPAFMSQALRGEPMTVFGDGSQTRSFCYVDDLVEGIWRLLLSDEKLPVNIGNPGEMTILQFGEAVRAATGLEVRVHLQTPAGGRPAGAPSGHRQGQTDPRMGARGRPGRGPRAHHPLLRRQGGARTLMAGDRILVTGGAGFIGGHVVERLLAAERSVRVLDNLDPYYDPAIKRRTLEHLRARGGSRFEFTEGDIRDPETCARALADVGVVIHLAALAGVRPSIAEPVRFADVNVTGTQVLLDVLAHTAPGHARLVFASSSSVYGGNRKVPFSEPDPVDHPVSPYAATKRAGELLCDTFHHLYGNPVTCLRLFTVYGPRQRPEMAIHRFARCIRSGQPIPFFGSGESRRDYTFVDDIVDGVTAATGRDSGYRIYNLGGAATTSLSELVGMLEELLGRQAVLDRLPDQAGDVPQTWADIGRAERELGYRCRVPLPDGLRRFCDWLIAQEGER